MESDNPGFIVIFWCHLYDEGLERGEKVTGGRERPLSLTYVFLFN